ncbi:MAG: outer-membrane lipoprotein carrier protein LolA [Muribaculaceae bacterium]|nr:outer-membrane lipoprotein carrier protein LolA [Muribaculaceae bacterium]
MKYIIKKILAIFTIMSSCLSSNAMTANEVLTNTSKVYNNSKSITASFAIIDNGYSNAGKITITGNKFVITTPQMSTWFDGKTQWTYSSSINEVNIGEPTAEELQIINPFSIIKDFQINYNGKLLDSAKGSYKIKLTPKKSNNDIKSIELTVNSTTYLPSLIVIVAKNNIKTTINIKNINIGGTLPGSTFVFNSANYPGVEVIDLR